MTRITNADQVLLLLQERLARAERRGPAGKIARASSRGGQPGPLERVRALAALDSLGEDERRRAVVHGVLAQAFGDEVGNDAAFRDVVDEVTRMIADMPGGPELVDRAAASLTTG